MGMKHILMSGVVISCAFASSVHAQTADGFGNDVPLSIAARQIVPSDISVNIDERLDRNSRVSWKGGQDWHLVLERTMAQKGARIEYDGKNVRIVQNSSGPIQTSQPMPMAQAPSFSSGGLMVLAPRTPDPVVAPPPAPVMISVPPIPTTVLVPSKPMVLSPVPAPSMPIVLTPASVPSKPIVLAPVPAPSMPIVLTPVSVPPIVPAPSATRSSSQDMQVSVPDNAQPETARQRASRLRMEIAHGRTTDMVNTNSSPPAIRNSQPVPKQYMTSGTWKALKGETLDQVLGDWSEKAGWTLAFNSQIVYELQAGAEFSGEYVEAVSALIRSVGARPVPIATFFKGNKVLRITNNISSN